MTSDDQPPSSSGDLPGGSVANHVAWCKARALLELGAGGGGGGVAALGSLISDVGKYDGTAGCLTPDVLAPVYDAYEQVGDAAIEEFVRGWTGPAR